MPLSYPIFIFKALYGSIPDMRISMWYHKQTVQFYIFSVVKKQMPVTFPTADPLKRAV